MTREEAIKIIESARAVVLCNGEYDEAMSMAIESLKAEPIVRCKDCKYYKQLNSVCPYLEEDGYYKEFPNKDDYCSRGKRKEVKE